MRISVTGWANFPRIGKSLEFLQPTKESSRGASGSIALALFHSPPAGYFLPEAMGDAPAGILRASEGGEGKCPPSSFSRSEGSSERKGSAGCGVSVSRWSGGAGISTRESGLTGRHGWSKTHCRSCRKIVSPANRPPVAIVSPVRATFQTLEFERKFPPGSLRGCEEARRLSST